MAPTANDATVNFTPSPKDVTLTRVGPGANGQAEPPAQFAPPGYEILGEIGRGGMGVVYKARHRSLNRLVALKVILGAGHAGSAQLSRFRAEAMAAAQLHHPNIVQVYEIGEWRSADQAPETPFISLELVEGGGLDQFLAGTPRPPRFAAELVRSLALAVQHAHEKGIVHRDLKPANILVSVHDVPAADASTIEVAPAHEPKESSGRVVAKITDFGLAKQTTAETHLTASGAILGTPSYMAPEQAAGKGTEVGPTADVYALGAILYECLTGRPPFRAASVMDTVMQVLHDEPVPPSKLQPRLPIDLETIALKCLAKRPDQRYPSAAALADDLRRFLDGESILARPASRVSKLWKWSRRHPAMATVVFILAVPIPVMLAVMVGLWVQARDARLAAEADRHEAHEARLAAEADRHAAMVSGEEAARERDLSKGYLKTTMQTMDRVLDIIGSEHLAVVPEFRESRQAVLDEAVALYESLLRLDGSKPEVRFEIAQTQLAVGRLHILGNNTTEADRAFQAALDILRPLEAEFADRPEYRHQMAVAHYNRGHVRLISGRMFEGTGEYLRAYDIMKALLEKDPDRIEYIESAAEIARSVAAASQGTASARSAQMFAFAIEQAERGFKLNPKSEFLRALLGNVMADAATAVANDGNVKMAEMMANSATAFLDETKVPVPKSNRARVYHVSGQLGLANARARIAVVSRKWDEAERLYLATAEKYAALAKGLPKSFPYRYQALIAHVALSGLMGDQKKWAKVIEYNRRGLELVDGLRRDFPEAKWLESQTANLQVQVGFAYAHTGKSKELGELLAKFDPPATPLDLTKYNIACLYSLGAERGPEGQRAAYRDRAIKTIAQIRAYPFNVKQYDHVTKDDDLKAIRDEPEFQAWLAKARTRLKIDMPKK